MAAETFYSIGLFRVLGAFGSHIYSWFREAAHPRTSKLFRLFFLLSQMSLRSGIASFPPESETALGHCNLPMIESAVEGCSNEQACCKNITKKVLDMSFLALGLQRCTTIRNLSQKGFRLYRLGPQCSQSQYCTCCFLRL